MVRNQRPSPRETSQRLARLHPTRGFGTCNFGLGRGGRWVARRGLRVQVQARKLGSIRGEPEFAALRIDLTGLTYMPPPLHQLRSFHDVGSSEDGFVGAITDTTRMKKSEALHLHTVEQRASDAEETRKQQEQFIGEQKTFQKWASALY